MPETSAASRYTLSLVSQHWPGPVRYSVSAPTASLLEGAGLRLEDAGEHELKGLAGARRMYRLVGLASN
jgi:class 3 adenylate cyclase